MNNKILIIILSVIIIFTGCETYESNLGKSRTVVIYCLDDDDKVIDYSRQKEIDWSKILKELKAYGIHQKIGNKLLIARGCEIGKYNYIKHKKEIIYKENEERFAVASALLVDNKILYINQEDLTDDYNEDGARLIKYDLESKKKTVIDENSSCDKRILFNKKGDIVYHHTNLNKEDGYEERVYTKSGKMYAYRDNKVLDIDTNKEVKYMSGEDFESAMSTTKDGKYSFEISVQSYNFNGTELARVLKIIDNETGFRKTLDEGKIKSGPNSEGIYDLRGYPAPLVIQLE
jgi:hypothetical protein